VSRVASLLRAALAGVVLAVFAFALIGPLANLALWSVAERWYTPYKLPVTYGTRYWEQVFRPTGDAMASLGTSVWIAVLTVVVALALSVPAGYALARLKLPMRSLFMIVFLLPQAFPSVAIYINVARIFYNLGINGTVLGVVLVHAAHGLVYSVWIAAAAFSSAGALSFIHVSVPPSLMILGLLYFLFGYLFYASIMMSVGALTSNLREATQFSGYFTLLNVCPFWVMWVFLNTPNSPLAVGMSVFPLTAPTSMMLRLSAATVSGAVIPPWQIATSLALLALSALVTLMLGSKLFRLGMLLYGKTPNLPEIMRILRQS